MNRSWFACVLMALASGCASIQSGMPDDPAMLRPTGSAEIPDSAPARLIAGEVKAPSADESPAPTPELPIAHAEEAPSTTGEAPESPAAPPAQSGAIQPQRPVGQADPAVETASAPAADPASAAAIVNLETDVGEPATEVAARVGETIITLRELTRAVRERMKPGVSWSQLSDDQKNQLGRESLEYLIDRALIIQEARRTLSKPKQWDTFKEYADKMWRDNELPQVMKRYGVRNEAALRQKLEEFGLTLTEIHESYMLDQMARIFTSERMREKYSEPGLREIYGYYRENIETFRRPAQTTWREIFIAVDEKTDRDAARSKASDLRNRLASGEDFAKLAQAESQSPKAAAGGSWQTSPGGFGSSSVNRALDQLPLGAVSEVLEDPKGFYIVRVEARQAAGPAPFEEVQGKIADVLRTRYYEKLMQSYLADVRGRTSVSSPLFDGGVSQPIQSAKTATRPLR
jgi:parvulin-like peptidyl-prolyl isomerase